MTKENRPGIVRRLDHLVVGLGDARAAHDFCARELALPIAWPFEDYGPFASGGIGLGNLNLELCRSGVQLPETHPARVGGLAFEPVGAVDERLARSLDEREIAHMQPSPTPGWTNMQLPSFFAQVHTFFCEYHIPGARDASLRAQALINVDGGVLKVQRARCVTIGARDSAETIGSWSRLFEPIPPSESGFWEFPEGTDIRVVESERDEVLDLVLETKDQGAAGALKDARGASDPLCGLPISFEVI